MEELAYLKVSFVLAFFLILVLVPLSIIYSRDFLKVVRKIFFQYLVVSLSLIFVFSCAYFIITVMDLQNLVKEYPNGLSQFNSVDKKIIFDNYFHIKNLSFDYYHKNVAYLFLDLIYFSSMTFFTVGYGDIVLVGIPRIFAILESIIGVSTTAVLIPYILTYFSKPNQDREKIKIYLNRGWEILNLKTHEKYLLRIVLINSNNKTEIMSIDNDSDFLKFIREFKINWNFKDNKFATEYYIRFCAYLYYQLYFLGHRGTVEAFNFYFQKSEIDFEKLLKFLDNLIDTESPDYKKLDDEVMAYAISALLYLKE